MMRQRADMALRKGRSTMRGSRAASLGGRGRTAVSGEPDPDLNGLLAEPRRMKILDWLQEEGSARVRDLSAAFGVSEATIRQDLEKLESDGHINRQHGGAFLRAMPRQVETLSLQHMENIDKKRKIGVKAASLVGEGETIILDAGSTTTEIAHNLIGRSSLTVITNALNIALMLGAVPGYAVHMPGGQFKAPTLSLSGDRAADYFEDVLAGKLFLATAGRRARFRPDPAELRRSAAQAGDDPGRLARLSRGRIRPRSTGRPSPVSAPSTSSTPSSPTTASATRTLAPSRAAASR